MGGGQGGLGGGGRPWVRAFAAYRALGIALAAACLSLAEGRGGTDAAPAPSALRMRGAGPLNGLLEIPSLGGGGASDAKRAKKQSHASPQKAHGSASHSPASRAAPKPVLRQPEPSIPTPKRRAFSPSETPPRTPTSVMMAAITKPPTGGGGTPMKSVSPIRKSASPVRSVRWRGEQRSKATAPAHLSSASSTPPQSDAEPSPEARARSPPDHKPRKSKKTGHKNGFNIFVGTHFKQIRKENPDKSFGEITSIVGERWKAMSDEDKRPYHDEAAEQCMQWQEAHSQQARGSSEPAPATEVVDGKDGKVRDWLRLISHGSGCDLTEFAGVFERHRFTVDMLPLLSYESLSEMEIPLGPRLWILEASSKFLCLQEASDAWSIYTRHAASGSL